MKFGKYIGYGVLTIFFGIITMFLFIGISGTGGNGEVTTSVFNAGIMALVGSIIFLCAVIVVCTTLLVNAIKSIKS